MVPMVDLRAQLKEIKTEIMSLLDEVVSSTTFILGPKLKELEQKIAEYHRVHSAIGVASGTDALHLALLAAGIGKGDEVITTPFTFFATVESIVYVGAKPVFVDIEPDTFNINPLLIEEKITQRTKAILPVHLYGQPADMDKIMEIAKKYNLIVIEDCAQAFGARIRGKLVGTFGMAGAFSFYPSKNLGAYGDGGMVITDNHIVAEKLRQLRNHGSSSQYVHDTIGFNSRLDEIQAAVLLVKFRRIEYYNELRRKKAHLYTSLLKDSDVKTPVEKEGVYHVYHQYTIRSKKRDQLQKILKEKGISSVVYYPVPMHLQKALSFLGYREGSLPEAERASREALSLPIYPEIEESVIETIANIIRGA
ncbi:MAG: DegT/DnrJ/EryC1/StrS family aminotransferase [Thermodesulfovibrionales bacterium]|nr:DegT/DnrJ/EryC1/StrS family aminotransferase [Thermodesulfovibrionales bacterium]